MKVQVQFSIAKHVPDLMRLEPRNIGVVVWGTGGFISRRFLGQDDDEIIPPPFVAKGMHGAYKQWLAFWNHHLVSESIRPRKGPAVPRESADFLKVLREKSKEAFRLVDGGVLREQVNKSDIPDIANDLFNKIVALPENARATHTESVALTGQYRDILKKTGIRERSDCHHDIDVPRVVFGELRAFKADLTLGPVGQPIAVFQRVLLTQDKNVNNNALMFDALIRDANRPIPKENVTALVDSRFATTESARAGMRMVSNVANVCDVAQAAAVERFREVIARATLSAGH